MAVPELCPNCRSELPANAPQGLCPACLLQQGLDSEDSVALINQEESSTGAWIGVISPDQLVDEIRDGEVDRTPAYSHSDGATRSYSSGVAPDDSDATLSYSVVKDGGQIEPLLSPHDLDQLATTFYPGVVLQGRYVLERELGRGAMGMVFLGRDNRLGRPVAVKAILPGDSGSRARGTITEREVRDRFTKEARIGANLTHPAIATVHDFGFHGDSPFTVFEYVDGLTLQEVMKRRGRIPIGEVRLIIGALAQALDFAHSRFIIHRDLKPANIKSDGQGQLKILDLGLATEFRHHADWSGFAGTPAYASPEQAAGLPSDGRSDQYSLAVITYELLAGQRPFCASRAMELLQMHRDKEPPLIRSLVPDVLESVELTILQAMQKDPERRFSNCVQFAVALGFCPVIEPSSAEETLLEGDVEFQGTRRTRRFRLPMLRKFRWGRFLWPAREGRLVLTRTSLWAVDRIRVIQQPLREITGIKGACERTGCLTLFGSSIDELLARPIGFTSTFECVEWQRSIDKARALRVPNARAEETGASRLVVLLRRRPNLKYQVLGPVAAHGPGRKSAQMGLQVRAAMIGADAVIDVQVERASASSPHRWSASGNAILAISKSDRSELLSRWFEGELTAKANHCLAFMLAYCVLTALYGVSGRNETLMGAAVTLTVDALLLGLPAIPVSLLRRSCRPELLRPAATACVSQSLFVFMIEQSRFIPELLYFSSSIGLLALVVRPFKPIPLACLAVSMHFAGTFRDLGATFSEFLSQAVHEPKTANHGYKATIRSAKAVLYLSIVLSISIVSLSSWTFYSLLRRARLQRTQDNAVRRKNFQRDFADLKFNEGIRYFQDRPSAALMRFSEALNSIESLPEDERDLPENRYLVAMCRCNIGILEFDSGRRHDGQVDIHRGVEILEQLSLEYPDSNEYVWELVDERIRYAAILTRAGAQVRPDKRAIMELADKNIQLLLRMSGLTENEACRKWLYLAQSYAYMGDLDEGRHWYDKCVQFVEADHSTDNEIIRLRAVAAQLLAELSRFEAGKKE
jgi:Protein kinase domain